MRSKLELHLDLAPSVLFLFGLSGAGKSYVGDIINELPDWFVYHADDHLTDELTLALKENRPFTNAMRDRFFSIVVTKIQTLQRRHRSLVVTQGVYKQRHRDYLTSTIPGMEMLHVEASDQIITKRLVTRIEGINIASASALRQDFDAPSDDIKVIINEGSRSLIIHQLNRFYQRST